MGILHYLDGKWVETKDLKISALDITVLRGFGVFDYLRTYNKKPFLLKEHINRLFNSANMLDISIPLNKKDLTDSILLGIKKNKKIFSDFSVRILITGGIGEDSTTPGKPSIVIIFTQALDYPKLYFEKGIKIITYKAKRTFPFAKTLNYSAGILALQKARAQKALEAIYIDDKYAYEGITSNFFGVVGGKLVTTKSDILIGVTRNMVLKIAKEKKIKVVERSIHLKEIPQFQEAFLTASNKEIMPVVRIDNKKVGNGKVGQITKELLAAYRNIVNSL